MLETYIPIQGVLSRGNILDVVESGPGRRPTLREQLCSWCRWIISGLPVNWK